MQQIHEHLLLRLVTTVAQILSLGNNSLEGTLPDSLWHSVWLRQLNLVNNTLVGTIGNQSTAFTLEVSKPAFKGHAETALRPASLLHVLVHSVWLLAVDIANKSW